MFKVAQEFSDHREPEAPVDPQVLLVKEVSRERLDQLDLLDVEDLLGQGGQEGHLALQEQQDHLVLVDHKVPEDQVENKESVELLVHLEMLAQQEFLVNRVQEVVQDHVVHVDLLDHLDPPVLLGKLVTEDVKENGEKEALLAQLVLLVQLDHEVQQEHRVSVVQVDPLDLLDL